MAVISGGKVIEGAHRRVGDITEAEQTELDTLLANIPQAAQADTSGATLAALETEVNALKAKLRTAGIIAP